MVKQGLIQQTKMLSTRFSIRSFSLPVHAGFRHNNLVLRYYRQADLEKLLI
jgi:hypothetical protein